MAAHNADRQHPAFNKMFIQTEALPSQQLLLAYRRSQTAEPADMYMAHLIATAPGDSPFQFETDRNKFIGRGNTPARPFGAVKTPANSQGFVLHPVFSLRRQFVLEPNQRQEVTFILAVALRRNIQVNTRLTGPLILPGGRPRLNCAFSTYSRRKLAGSSSWPTICCSRIRCSAPRLTRSLKTERDRPGSGPTAFRVICRLSWSPLPNRGT